MISDLERPPRDAASMNPRRALTLVLVVLLLGLLGVWRHRTRVDDAVHDFAGATMGTSWSARVDASLSARRRDEVRSVIQERLDSLDRMMSSYDSTSELNRFNRHVSTDPFPVSDELFDVLVLARDVSARSGGAFDVTVAPYVDAWGFGPAEPREPPDEGLLASLSSRVGYDLLVLDTVERTVAKANPETRIDLSAIAKGYAAERVGSALRDMGLSSFLVEVGGELSATGRRRDGRSWRVGIERPDDRSPGYWGTVDLTDEGIATSGDYRNYHEVNGVEYAHIIDPRAGRPIRVRRFSVSVVHRSAAMADAWATALTVLGPNEGYALARSEGLATLFLVTVDGGFQSLMTPALGNRVATGDATGEPR
jgi:FAD:protein FMN transferase